MVDWYSCKHEFVWDGSVRDVYVFNTTEHDYDLFLDALEQWEYRLDFTIDGDPALLPNGAWRLFDMQPEASPMLELHVGSVRVRCHFFCSSEMELDVDPRDIQSQADLNNLTNFIVRLGKIVDKNVYFSPENAAETPIFEYHAAEDALTYHEPPQAATG